MTGDLATCRICNTQIRCKGGCTSAMAVRSTKLVKNLNLVSEHLDTISGYFDEKIFGIQILVKDE